MTAPWVGRGWESPWAARPDPPPERQPPALDPRLRRLRAMSFCRGCREDLDRSQRCSTLDPGELTLAQLERCEGLCPLDAAAELDRRHRLGTLATTTPEPPAPRRRLRARRIP